MAVSVNPNVSGIRVTKKATIRDSKASGQDAGTFTSGAWRTRVLNVLVDDDSIGITLASNQFVLPPGRYWIEASAPAREVDSHAVRIFNVTANAEALTGEMAVVSSGTAGIASRASVSGRINITVATTFELQHQCASTKNTVGLGSGAGFTSFSEVFAGVDIEQY